MLKEIQKLHQFAKNNAVILGPDKYTELLVLIIGVNNSIRETNDRNLEYFERILKSLKSI